MSAFITAALIWYNEPLELLDRCVRAAGQVADRIVAVDGAYARFPNAQVTSPPEQAEIIREAARQSGMEPVIITPTRLWRGQCEKRSYLMSTAAEDSAWMMVIDADHIVESANRDAIWSILESHNAEGVFEVPMLTPTDPVRSINETAASKWHANLADVSTPIPHFFRSYPGYQVERYHWWYSAYIDGHNHWIYGGDGSRPSAIRSQLPVPSYRVIHVALLRDRDHMLVDRAFINDREGLVRQTGQEDDVPDFPRPEWDYQSMKAG